ncbi:MAG: cation:proton antiporter [Parcubacteria group bacterium]|nr:cation:proton antiporter [Parcubacteria group bacterium]
MPDIFIQLALVVALAVGLAALMRLLRQPLLVGYILTGVLAGPLVFGLVHPGDALEVFAHLGVSLLLFMVGLGLNMTIIRQVGSVSVLTGIAQMLITSTVGVVISLMIGYGVVEALYLAVALSFSSTIIVLRLLQDREETDSLHGRIAIGFLLIQDLIAMLVFIFLSASDSSESWLSSAGLLLVKTAALALVLFLLGRFIIPRVERFVGKNRELLLLSSLGFCFVGVAAFEAMGFSRELGALAAGVLLSSSPYFREIASRIQPLRDFFLVIFFVFMGANIVPTSWAGLWWPVAVFSAFVLVGNPLILLLIMAWQGYTRKMSFLVGLTVAQISEFSLILVATGMSLGHLNQNILTVITLVGLVTISACSYMMAYNEQLYRLLLPILRRLTPFAHERSHQQELADVHGFEILLLGAHRLGGGLLKAIQAEGLSYLVVDHDPHLIAKLKERHVLTHFGSADDPVMLDSLDFSGLKLVISTIPDMDINRFLMDYLRQRRANISFIAVAHHREQAEELYNLGATYVVMPPYLGRRFMVDLFRKNLFSPTKYARERDQHLHALAALRQETL